MRIATITKGKECVELFREYKMGIPESQLETWSHQGAVTTAKATHKSIRNAIHSYDWPEEINFEIYLHGSYKNSTNIYSDSDVDVVVQLNSSFYSNLTAQQKRYLSIIPASYRWEHFRQDILSSLRNYYNHSKIKEGDKCIKLESNGNRLQADIVVATQYRKYRSINIHDFVEGMTFWTKRDGNQIINYPKLHYENGTNKNSRTNGWYKPTVRIFKNIRTYLVKNGIIEQSLAPSYFLECLIYNANDENFGYKHTNSFINVLNWLCKSFSDDMFQDFLCQNEQSILLGFKEGCWSPRNAIELLKSIINIWKAW